MYIFYIPIKVVTAMLEFMDLGHCVGYFEQILPKRDRWSWKHRRYFETENMPQIEVAVFEQKIHCCFTVCCSLCRQVMSRMCSTSHRYSMAVATKALDHTGYLAETVKGSLFVCEVLVIARLENLFRKQVALKKHH